MSNISKSSEMNSSENGFTFRPISPSKFTPKSEELAKKQVGHKFSSDKLKSIYQNLKGIPPKKSDEGFQFSFTSGTPNPDLGIFKKNTINSEIAKATMLNFDSEKDVLDVKESTESMLEEKSKVEADSNITKTDLNDGDKMDSEVKTEEQKSEEETKSEEYINVKTLFKEFKGVINEFFKERIESEKRISALEEKIAGIPALEEKIAGIPALEQKIAGLEREIESLKKDSEKISTSSSIKRRVESEEDSFEGSRTTSTEVPLFKASSVPVKSLFESTPTLLHATTSSSSLFSSEKQDPVLSPTNRPVFTTAPLFGTSMTPANFEFGKSVFPSVSTQTQKNKILFTSTTSNEPTSANNGAFLFNNDLSLDGFNNGIDGKLHTFNVKPIMNGTASASDMQNNFFKSSKELPSDKEFAVTKAFLEPKQQIFDMTDFKKSMESLMEKAFEKIFSDVKNVMRNNNIEN